MQAYHQCMNAWVSSVVEGSTPVSEIVATSPPVGYEELGIDVKRAVLLFQDYVNRVAKEPSHGNVTHEFFESIATQFAFTKQAAMRWVNNVFHTIYDSHVE